MSTIIKSISVTPEFDKLMKENKLSWSEAARIGAAILFGDNYIAPYDNSINLYRKMRKYQALLETTMEKLNKLEKQHGSEEIEPYGLGRSPAGSPEVTETPHVRGREQPSDNKSVQAEIVEIPKERRY